MSADIATLDDEDEICPRCQPLGCDCDDSQNANANVLPSGRICRCGAHAKGGDCMCFEDDV